MLSVSASIKVRFDDTSSEGYVKILDGLLPIVFYLANFFIVSLLFGEKECLFGVGGNPAVDAPLGMFSLAGSS